MLESAESRRTGGMNGDQLLEAVAIRAKDHQRRAVAAAEGLTSEQFNAPVDGEWCVARVFKHLCLANEPYLDLMEEKLKEAGAGSVEVKHSFFGKMLMKFSGPDGNAPAPAFLIPPEIPLSPLVVDEWKNQQERLVRLANEAKGKNLSFGVRNPFIKFLRMNLGDLFAIYDTHTERHVRQIEQRAAKVRSA